MIKAIRKACFYIGLFACMCVFVYALMHAAYRQGQIQAMETEVITVAHASHLKTSIEWDLLEPRRVLPTMPGRKPE